MPRRLSGPLIFYRDGREVSAILNTAASYTRRLYPSVRLSHAFASAGYTGSYGPWHDSYLSRSMDDAGIRCVRIASFPNEEEARKGGNWLLRISLTETHTRGDRCTILDIGLSEQLVSNQPRRATELYDSISRELLIESGHVHDSEHFAEQNQISVGWFKLIGRPVAPERIRYSDEFGKEVVDLEQNPCHCHTHRAVDFTAAWTVYLGKQFLQHVPRARVETLDAEVVELHDSLMRVTLYDDPFAFNEPANIEKLWSFRRILGIDAVAHTL